MSIIRLPDGVNQNLVFRGGVSLYIGIAHYSIPTRQCVILFSEDLPKQLDCVLSILRQSQRHLISGTLELFHATVRLDW